MPSGWRMPLILMTGRLGLHQNRVERIFYAGQSPASLLSWDLATCRFHAVCGCLYAAVRRLRSWNFWW